MNGLDYFDGKNEVVRVKETNTKLLLIGVGSIIVGFVLSGIFSAIARSARNSSFTGIGAALCLIGIIAGTVLIVISAGKSENQRRTLSDDSYDSLVKNLIDKRASNAKEYLGLDESEIMEIEPIELSGYIFSGAQRYKMGNDRLYRSNLFEKAIIFFTRNEVHMYKATVDSITGKTTENTEVLFYEDIVSVSTENENERFGNVSIDYLSFVLTSKGGKPFKVALLGTDNRQRSINAMRALIKEKKMK